jgi:lipopolysaccharide/colanic/teichoic acid biosynthesis glycosyltransferase
MGKRLFDLLFSSSVLLLTSPIWVLAAAGIAISDGRPLLYRACRVGLEGRRYFMFKFRTMRREQAATASAITAFRDPRVFPFGRFLRALKIDELPQFLNVLRGEMSVVGPRPEDPVIVERHYTEPQKETLRVLPGIASPGGIYNYTHGEKLLDGPESERTYIDVLLPVKLALEMVYVRRASFLYDLRIIARTIGVIIAIAARRKSFPRPPEYSIAHGSGLLP